MKRYFIKYRICIVFILCLPILTSAAIYKKIDSNGKVYFSDRLMPEAVLIQLKPVNIYSSTQAVDNSVDKTSANQQTTAESTYKKFTMIQPNEQQTFQNQPEIQAVIEIEPALKVGDKVEWCLDGALYQQSQNTQITLGSLNRGEHKLQAKLRGINNQILLISQTVTFFVHYPRFGS